MRIGVPKEIKNHEYRVGLTPAAVRDLRAQGHEVHVQRGAGSAVGFSDDDYAAAGAHQTDSAAGVYACDMVVKVKELQPPEYRYLRPGLLLFAYLQLAPDRELLDRVLAARISALGYETVTDAEGRLPLLAPMSRIAGRMSIQIGAWALQMQNGGSGVLLPGVQGVPPGKVVVLGAGTSGRNAVHVAAGLGADVTVFDVQPERLDEINEAYAGSVKTHYAEPGVMAEAVTQSDLVVGAILIPGKLAPKVITRRMVRSMRRGSVIVDIAIDQGGVSETSRMTSHAEPLYVEEGVLHYCVPNMPAACARTATQALVHATLPYVLRLADAGLDALRTDTGFAAGLQAHRGHVTHRGLAEDCGRTYVPFEISK